VELVRRNELTLEPEGRLIERQVLVRYLLNEAGVRDHGNVVHSARGRLSRVVVEEAWVRDPRGRISDFAPETLQIVSDSEPDVFSDVHNLVFAFANLEPGATVVLVVRTEMRLDAWPLPWSRIFLTQLFAPTELFELVVRWTPDASAAPHWATDDAKLRCDEAAGSLRCEARNVAATAYDPHVVWADQLPHVVVGASRSWRDLASSELEVVLQAASEDAGVAAALSSLALGEEEERERLQRIHRFVADQIRYVAFAHGSAAVVPHPASTTLFRRFGDCKDKVTLFLALAAQAGLAARPVLVATNRYASDKLLMASWRYFDHMIACVDLASEETVCLDLTDPHSETGSLPLSLQGAVALELRPGSVAPTTLPMPTHLWTIEVGASNELACDGSVQEQLIRRFHGPSAAMLRGQLSAMSSEERERWLRDSYTDLMGDSLAPSLSLDGLRDSHAQLSLRSSTHFEGNGRLADVEHWSEPDAWLAYYARQFRSQNRRHPYRMGGLHVTSRNAYTLCREARVGFVGARLALQSEIGSLARSYEKRGDHEVIVETVLDLPARMVAAAEADAFNGILMKMLDQTRIWFSIEPTAPELGRSEQ